ncbi:hypothetical protein EB796_012146 [Bugula neritina]|uniref:Uncharacterized protein n=1 Tax=Bugula neritina TaxID=10212 RepID=A0A7J7JUE6_BUGNE|nr:hypothetical protein EB796_012146 [Bugula neritina]
MEPTSPIAVTKNVLLSQRNLISAAEKGNVSAVRKVLHSHQVDPDAKIKNAGEERSPLHIACGYGQHSVVAELLKAGADPCASSSSGRTPLHDACQGVT